MLSVVFKSCRDGVWIFGAIGKSSNIFKYPGRFSFVFMGLLSCCYIYCPYTERVNQKIKVRGNVKTMEWV